MAAQKQRKGLNDILGETAAAPSTPKLTPVAEVTATPASLPKAARSQTTLYLDKVVLRQVRELAIAEDVKPHDLYLEALNMLFKQRGLKSIDELTSL